jgi:hypothetical protein
MALIPYWYAYALGGTLLASGLAALWRSEPLTGLRNYGSVALQVGTLTIVMTAFFQFVRN